jgi:hypothetical protein
MKNIRIVVLFLFVFTALTVTQSLGQIKKGFTFGIKGGVNLTKLTMGEVLGTRYDSNGNPYLSYDGQQVRDELKESFDSKTGYSGGIYMRFGRNLYIQPEILISTKGGSFDIVQSGSGGVPLINTVDYKFSTIDVPILFGIKGGPFRLNAGPAAYFKINDNQKLGEAIKYYTANGDHFSEAVYGYQLGAGIDIFGISLDVRKEGSFSDIATFQVNPGSGPVQVGQKLSSWQVTIGIKLI